MAALPAEILYPILVAYIEDPTTTLYRALSLRLLSRNINDIVVHQLFALAHLDSKESRLILKQGRHLCKLCNVPIRPERIHQALNRVTVSRYLLQWLVRDYGDATLLIRDVYGCQARMDLWTSMTRAIASFNESTRDDLQTSSKTISVDKHTRARSGLAHAIITMYGVRCTWTFFSPHHGWLNQVGGNCQPRHHPEFPSVWWAGVGRWAQGVWRRECWPDAFWRLILAAFYGDLGMLRHHLETLGLGSQGAWAAYVATTRPSGDEERLLDDWSSEPRTVWHWRTQVLYLAAAATVAVRQGHDTIISCLLESGLTRSVCCDLRFWNGRTVLGTLFATTADENVQVARIAAKTIRKLICEWRRTGLWMRGRWLYIEHLTWALDTSTQSGVLLQVLEALYPAKFDDETEESLLHRLWFHLLCQAALNNDVERAEMALEAASWLGRKDSLVHIGLSSEEWDPWTSDAAYALHVSTNTDEFGVRCHRLMETLNPVRIAAALAHQEILEWLLGSGHQLVNSVKPWQLKAKTKRAHLKLKRHASTQVPLDSPLLDARREAVHDVFINPQSLPIAYRAAAANIICLDLILSKSADMSWGRETVSVAGTKGAEVLQIFVDYTDLGMSIPHNKSIERDISFKRSDACTVGEQAFLHALKARRLDNVRLLLDVKPELAELIPAKELSSMMSGSWPY